MKGTGSESWGATPPLRKLWSSAAILKGPPTSQAVELTELNPADKHNDSYSSLASEEFEIELKGDDAVRSKGQGFLHALPGIAIAVIVNSFLSISFGSAFFPTQWDFPVTVSRSLGSQMFLLSTAIGQVVMAFSSSFPCAISMMMVENIPFMHTIALSAIAAQGQGEEAFATCFASNIIMSMLVGVAFWACGHYQAGFLLNIIPKSLILGCIGGIGIFIFRTGAEVSTGQVVSLSWFTDSASAGLWRLLGASIAFEVVLRLIQFGSARISAFGSFGPLIPPLYFCAIPVVFYCILYYSFVPLSVAKAGGWFFPSEEGDAARDYFAVFRLLKIENVSWVALLESVPTMLASTVFAFLHVPLNVPALKLTSGQEDVDINQELTAHAYSNFAAALLGQPQNYLCYSNSVLYHRCLGSGRAASLCVAVLSMVLFFVGPSIIQYCPRCMPGCLLIHIGIDLFREGLIDTIGGFDLAEYSIVVGLAVIMTVWGMTTGLCVGVVAAAVAYLVQSVSYVSPVRRSSHCSALRSTKLRSRRAARLLPALLRRVFWLQLQGSLFFGNSQTISQELSKALEAAEAGPWAEDSAEDKAGPWAEDSAEDKPLVVIADFTLVLGIDSSAVDSIKSLAKVCAKNGCACVYVRGSPAGFPTFSNLSDSLRLQASLQRQRRGQRRRTSSTNSGCGDNDFETGSDGSNHGGDTEVGGLIFVVDDLDSALSLAEDLLLASQTDLATDLKELKFQEFLRNSPLHLVQLLHFAPNPRLVGSLMSHFSQRTVRAGDVLWRQGDKSESCILLRKGKLRAQTAFNGKAETELQLNSTPKGSSQEYVFEDILVGHLVGEFGLLKNDERTGALLAIEDSTVLELTWPAFYAMQDEEKLLLHGICLQYLDLRTRRVDNFVASAQSLPV